ncbi:hypothetical protein GL218_04836 [Daldinia childiae]|uniref:uncharacterized protein n=1 Tax=Daldinia childiae TaxID=326645 RepID=UPI0014469EE6|nr:uncharacterized protein GL218_04836 [Daldinia childiae]KAF3059616.1 hypothetical protein GL218_04836 [Daldinia childiae]
MSAAILPLPGADQPDENRGPEIAGAVVSTTIAALVVVCARIYVRLRMIRSIGIDDYVMLVAMLLSLIGMGIIIAQVHYGAGRHAAYLDQEVPLDKAVNIVTDLFFALLPIPILWNVKINARTKASLICVLGLGVFACAAAIVKAAFLSSYGKSGDFLWDSANLSIWVVVETNTGIIAACLPCIKPMFKTIFESSLRYRSSRKKDEYNLHDYAHSTGPKGSKYLHTQTRTEIDARRVAVPNGLADNISEESILTQKTSGITKTTIVTIDRDIEENGEASGWHKDYPERVVEDRL